MPSSLPLLNVLCPCLGLWPALVLQRRSVWSPPVLEHHRVGFQPNSGRLYELGQGLYLAPIPKNLCSAEVVPHCWTYLLKEWEMLQKIHAHNCGVEIEGSHTIPKYLSAYQTR
ncbi:hypothetical protein EX30DRAFT_366469 [Ascodesmis nigricans]|uniref:Uncharacterized protein n=1 Tax=Ascodesmis nigricans TaxID=341454 RepID=A0A4S2ML92_9PEZI|nr:hypothetical protein EX30DRAFT_366469 [Ascodesmis nigricans]